MITTTGQTPLAVSLLAIVLTLVVLSRIVGDNPLFRVAQYLFVGTSLGLAFVIAYHQVLVPAINGFVGGLSGGNQAGLALYGIPLLLGLMLLPRISRRQEISWLANIPLALVFGVGAALAIGGAVIGTLRPQILDTAAPQGSDMGALIGAVVLALGTIATLSSFYYTVPREGGRGQLIAGVSLIGHWLLMVAFGFFFASAVQTYMTALTERLQFLLQTIMGLVGG